MKKNPSLYNAISQRDAIAGWAYFAFELLFLPSVLLSIAATFGLGDAVVNFTYYLLNFFVVFSIFKSYLLGSLEHAANHLGHFLLAVVVGFLGCWIANYLGSWLLECFSPSYANVNDQSISNLYAQAPVLIFLGTVLFVPTAEECLFRGLIFGRLHSVNKYLAYAVSVVAFCAVHVVGYLGSYPTATLALCFAQYIPSGLLLAWSYRHSGSIIAPILIHTAINAAAILNLM